MEKALNNKYVCNHYHHKILEEYYEMSGYMSHEFCDLRFCFDCNTFFKYRYQWDDGCGNDNIEIFPGEEQRGYSFTWEEFYDIILTGRLVKIL